MSQILEGKFTSDEAKRAILHRTSMDPTMLRIRKSSLKPEGLLAYLRLAAASKLEIKRLKNMEGDEILKKLKVHYLVPTVINCQVIVNCLLARQYPF